MTGAPGLDTHRWFGLLQLLPSVEATQILESEREAMAIP